MTATDESGPSRRGLSWMQRPTVARERGLSWMQGLSWMTGARAPAARGLSWMSGSAPDRSRGLSWMSGSAPDRSRGLSWMSGSAALDRRGLSWMRGAAAALLGTLMLMTAMPAAQASEVTTAAGEYVLHVGDRAAAAEAIDEIGGDILTTLESMDIMTVALPDGGAGALAAHPAVVSIAPNARLQLQGWDGRASKHDMTGAMQLVREGVTHAEQFWGAGFDGSGVDVALIDSGVVAVDGLTRKGKVLNGPDLSFESQADHLRYLDTFGHGTHMAGIIGGIDDDTPQKITGNRADRYFMGMAPGARIVSIKVADANGATDVSQVIAAIDWIVQHRNADGLNIRVLNLSFGTDSAQDYRIDPLSYAVEVAWRSGIVVVAAAGNDGNRFPLRNPAHDPFVIAVGADAAQGTGDTDDDQIPAFSNCGTSQRSVDLVAPGKSIISLGAPGSAAWQGNPDAIVGDRFMKGSGTSQAAAVVSGAAALIVDQRPGITPDQVKALLTGTAAEIPGVSARCQGAGVLDLKAARNAPTPLLAVQTHQASTGLGSLDAARGTHRLVDNGVVLDGERDIFGKSWDPAAWADLSIAGASWNGGSWNGSRWTGASWNGASWNGASWNGASWSGASWNGASWNGQSWNGASWNGGSWSGRSWSGGSWSTGVWLTLL